MGECDARGVFLVSHIFGNDIHPVDIPPFSIGRKNRYSARQGLGGFSHLAKEGYSGPCGFWHSGHLGTFLNKKSSLLAQVGSQI